MVKRSLSEDFKESANESKDFYEASKSIKVHKNTVNEEDKTDLIRSNSLQDSLKVLNTFNKDINELNEEESQKFLLDFVNQLVFLKEQKKNFEEIFKKKNVEIKLHTKKCYEKAMRGRLYLVFLIVIFVEVFI